MPGLLSQTPAPDIIASFVGGLLSFFSPCLLPLIPMYIMFLQGNTEADMDKKTAFRVGLIRSLGFVLGFTIVFMLLGFTASALGQFLVKYKDIIARIGGLFIIFFGLTMMGVIRLNALSKDYRKNTTASSVAMGMAFAFGWTPCFGPIVGAILANTAVASSNVAQGMFLLFVYSMGLAIPFILTYLFINTFERILPGLNKHSQTVSKIGGVMLVIFGIIMVSGKMSEFTAGLMKLFNK